MRPEDPTTLSVDDTTPAPDGAAPTYPESANLYQSYVRGYRHGSGGKAKDSRFVAHATLGVAYLDGYAKGREDTWLALLAASERYGYEPRFMRSDDGVMSADTPAPDGAPNTRDRSGGKISDAQLLDAIADAIADDLESLTDEELREQAAEDGLDFAAEAERIRAIMLASAKAGPS